MDKSTNQTDEINRNISQSRPVTGGPGGHDLFPENDSQQKAINEALHLIVYYHFI